MEKLPVTRDKSSAAAHLTWIDQIKAIALIWIFVNHLAERLFGTGLYANPSRQWPPFAEQIAQLTPLHGYGLLDVPLNLLRYLGWNGDHAVQIFLVVSGFGLTWSLLSRNTGLRFPLRTFYERRIGRVYPLWWAAHLFFVVTYLLLGWGIWFLDLRFVLSIIGIRFTTATLYYFSPAWWYIGLLVQLYLIFPALWWLLKKVGPLWLLVLACAVTFVARAAGFIALDSYLEAWHRGAVFVTQLAPFVFGMSLATWLFKNPDGINRRLHSPIIAGLAVGLYGLSFALSFVWLGWSVVPILAGVSAFLVCYALLFWIRLSIAPVKRFSEWLGEHSLSIFLMHHPFILLFLPMQASPDNMGRVLLGILLAIVFTLLGAILLERVTTAVQYRLGQWRSQFGMRGLALRLIGIGVGLVVVLLGAEGAARQFAPQEVYGWGERPALEANPTLGWHLKPSTTVNLRWASYNYVAQANNLGFPGPAYPADKTSTTFRILTTGDAFTSAEGVNTDLAWPRLLEVALKERLPGKTVEVMNFAMTGYGPNQYKAVLDRYAPVYKPDLIVVEMFVNDYGDVLISDEAFQRSIGFSRPDPNTWKEYPQLLHWRKLIELEVYDRLVEVVDTVPNPNGYFLGNFKYLQRNWPDRETGSTRVKERLAQIKQIAETAGSKLMVVLVPAPVQVCSAGSLAYYPRHVDLNDSRVFDLDLPQRMTRDITAELQIEYHDLLPILKGIGTSCPYQPNNMHWLPVGHQAVANYLSTLITGGDFAKR